MAIFGGGYEPSADPNRVGFEGDSTAAGWTDQSRAIFMVSLTTGQVVASVEFDSTGIDGPDEMIYALPSSPAVIDLNFDGFADVVYIGDLGGQVWKWDIQAVGQNTTGDSRMDNWDAGVFFDSPPVDMGGGIKHYRSFYNPMAAAYVNGMVTLAFGSAERNDLLYEGDATKDDENRFYVVRDLNPTGASAFSTVLTESDLTNITSADTDTNLNNSGFFFVGEENEKFTTDFAIFAGHVIFASFKPEVVTDICGTAGGESFAYVLDIANGAGYFATTGTPIDQRRTSIGSGLPSSPSVTMGDDPDSDVVFIKTSNGQIFTLDPPDPGGGIEMIYWRQTF